MFVFTTPAPAAAVVRGWTEHLTTLRSDLDGYGPVLAEPVADERMVRGLMAWSTVFGHVSLELSATGTAACSTTTPTSPK